MAFNNLLQKCPSAFRRYFSWLIREGCRGRQIADLLRGPGGGTGHGPNIGDVVGNAVGYQLLVDLMAVENTQH